MTLPLLTQSREGFHGPRYVGALASIHADNEFGPWWCHGMEFETVGHRPPFPWAGQTTTKGDT